MASLKELKLRIGSVKSTQKITKAKQMVAAAKLRKAQAAAEAARPYSSRLEAVVASLASKIAGGSGEGASPLLAGTRGARLTELLKQGQFSPLPFEATPAPMTSDFFAVPTEATPAPVADESSEAVTPAPPAIFDCEPFVAVAPTAPIALPSES